MIISPASSRDNGFKKWSDAHKRPIGPVDSAKPRTVVLHNRDADVITHGVAERPRGPWLVPGVGSSI